MTQTPVPRDFRVTWSFSSLSTYDLCPRKYWAEKIAKVAKFEEGPKTVWGTKSHEALEHFIASGTPLPSNMEGYQTTADKVKTLADLGNATHCESKLAVTKDGTPCGWFGADAYGRAILDVHIEMGVKDIVIDYKTGKYRKEVMQPMINAWMLFQHNPALEVVTTAFAYIAHGKTSVTNFSRDTIEDKFTLVRNKLEDLHRSVDNQAFPMRKNFLCKNYCSHFACPHNGRTGPNS